MGETAHQFYFDPTSDTFSSMKWYTVREVARKTGYSVRTVRQYITDGKIHAEKHGRLWWVPESAVARICKK